MGRRRQRVHRIRNGFAVGGIGPRYRPVVDAVCAAIADGINFTRPTQLELQAAEDFLELVPGAEMVKFAKNGSDATTAAVRLARAATGRETVAICNHPFFSVDDWFMVTTEMSSGIPKSVGSQTVRFEYNNLKSLETLFAEHPDSVAAVIMEAATATAEPAPGFLEGVRALCDRHGTVLIFDEIITGFRWSVHGAQTIYGVTPDLSCWGKALGNGFPISALAGRRDIMELGGLNTDRDRVFLLSTTYGAETAGLAAFRAVAAAYRDDDPIATMEASGRRLADGVNEIAHGLGLADYFQVLGRPSCLVFATRDAERRPSQSFRTLFLQEILQRGVLGQSFVVSAAHTTAEVDQTIDVVGQALRVYGQAIDAGSADDFLIGAAVAPALRRLAHPRRLGA